MPRINDLNLNNWQEKNVKFYGDKYKIKKAYDIDDVGIGRYGFDICGEGDKFLCHFVGDNINNLKRYIKTIFYKNYEDIIPILRLGEKRWKYQLMN